MPSQRKNWKFSVLVLLIISLCTSLGVWQLLRAQQKKNLLASFQERIHHTPFISTDLERQQDVRFHRVELTGSFDNQHTLLLDNKIFHGKVGYEVFTPFRVQGLEKPILIDRGFIPMGAERNQLPGVNSIIGKVTIIGMLNLPPSYLALGKINESSSEKWPLRIEFINLDEISKILNQPIFQYIVSLEPKDPAAYAIEWQIATMPPEKHMGYAIQWFALALTLLILFVILNRSRSKHN